MNTAQVKALFENTHWYVTYSYNLRIRSETLGYFLGEKRYARALDMPCGTGDISRPYVDRMEQLTLMDFSGNMIRAARACYEGVAAAKVKFIHSDFYSWQFGEERFDLILNIGILAHIDDPLTFVRRSVALLAPGGTLVIQNTDASHWYARLIHVYLSLRRVLGMDSYALNKVSERALLRVLHDEHMQVRETYRYNQSFLGLSRLFSDKRKYKLTRKIFGTAAAKRNQSLGCDVTYCCVKMESDAEHT